jgi:tetratricopeptide (TPR) repeat protein/predicted Ser/Thr protein kinase
VESTHADALPKTPDPDRAPVRLGHHVLLHKLGAGGMGVVYAAYDERLDRRVAIKLLRRQGSARTGLRLVREAQALARLSHPNVVQIYEIGEFDEQPFLVMELIDGVTLNRWRAERPRTRAELLEVFLAAGRGLAAAHAKGLIHRDFKPDNVMIRRDGQVVVMDFGLARGDERPDPSSDELEPTDEPGNVPTGDPQEVPPEPILPMTTASGSNPSVRSSELDRTLTEVGTVVGTVGYMAPEQLFGESVLNDRCDQFSFCAALWEALYDKRPFRGTHLEAFARSVLRGPPKPPESSSVPVWLRKVLERGLARNPDERWPSMNELLDALQRDPTRRRRGWLAAVGSLALGIAGFTAAYVAEQRQREQAEQQRAEQIAACEREGQAIAQDWNEEVATAIEQGFLATKSSFAMSAWQHTQPWFDGYAREWSAVRTQVCVQTTADATRSEDSQALVNDCLDESRMYFGAVLQTLIDMGPEDASLIPTATTTAARLHPPSVCTNEAQLQHRQLTPESLRGELTELRLQLERARARSLLGEHQQALGEAQAIIVAANELGWSPLIVRAGCTASAMQARLGKYADAKRTAQEAYWAAAGDSNDLGMLQATTELSAVLGHLADYEEGHGWALLGQRLVEKLELNGTLSEAVALERLSLILRGKGKYQETLPHQIRTAEIYETVLGPDHPTFGIALMNLGGNLSYLGDYRTALEYKYRALEVLETALGPEHSDVGAIYNNIGFELDNLGDYERALEFYQRALANFEAALGSEHPNVALVRTNVAVLLCKRGECEEALKLHQRSLAAQEAELGAEHPQVGITHQRIANALHGLGAHDDALEHQRRALSILEAKHGPEHAAVLDVRIDMAASLREQGQTEQAIEQFGAALAVFERKGELTTVFSHALVEYGLALLDHGDVAAAREQLERALTLHEQQDRVGVELARARFALALALWASDEQGRARELAGQARDGYRASGQFGARGLPDVEAWLREHPE